VGKEYNMTREDIKECLNHPKKGENNKKLLSFCREPKAFDEMKNSRVLPSEKLFDSIVDLKKIGALNFSEGKYFSTKEGLEVLKSIQ
jgi:hypothetical protein